MGAHSDDVQQTGERMNDFAREAIQAANDPAGNGSRYVRSNVPFIAHTAADLIELLNDADRLAPDDRGPGGARLEESLRRLHEYCLFIALTDAGSRARTAGQDVSTTVHAWADGYRDAIEKASGPQAKQLVDSSYRGQNVYTLVEALKVVAAIGRFNPDAPRPDGDALGLTVEQLGAIDTLVKRLPAVRGAAAYEWDRGPSANLASQKPMRMSPQTARTVEGAGIDH